MWLLNIITCAHNVADCFLDYVSTWRYKAVSSKGKRLSLLQATLSVSTTSTHVILKKSSTNYKTSNTDHLQLSNMFSWIKTTTVPSAPSKEERDAVSAKSPADSAVALTPPDSPSSSGPTQAPNNGDMGPRAQGASPPPLATSTRSTASSTDVRALQTKVAYLQGECESLKEEAQLRRDMTHQWDAKLLDKGRECDELHGTVRHLWSDLEKSKGKSDQLQAERDDLVDDLAQLRITDSMQLRSKDKEIYCLQEKIKGLKHKIEVLISDERNLFQQYTELAKKQQLLPNEHSELAELQSIIGRQGYELIELQCELDAAQASTDQLRQDCDQLSTQIESYKQQIDSFNTENGVLAGRIAVADKVAADRDTLICSFQQQVQTLSEVTAAEQQKQQAQIDALYAQKEQDRQRFEAQLQAKDNAVRDLEAKLQQSEAAAAKQLLSRDDQLASLQDQLRRVALDRDSEKAQAEAWADYANSQ